MNKYLRALFTLIVFNTLTKTFPLQQLLNFLNCYKHFTLTCLQWPPFWKRNKKYTTLKCAHASVVQTKSPSTVVVADVAAVCRELCVSIKRKAKLARKVVLRRPSSGAPHHTKQKQLTILHRLIWGSSSIGETTFTFYIQTNTMNIFNKKKKKLIIGHTHRLDSIKYLINWYLNCFQREMALQWSRDVQNIRFIDAFADAYSITLSYSYYVKLTLLTDWLC